MAKSTTNLALPYPESSDNADAPHDFKALADKLDATQWLTANIKDKAVTTGKLEDNAVTNAKMADNSVGSAEIQTGAVGPEEIAGGAVEESELAVSSVTNTKIGTGQVSRNKLAAAVLQTVRTSGQEISAGATSSFAVIWDTPFASTNYTVSLAVRQTGGATFGVEPVISAKTTSSCAVVIRNDTAAPLTVLVEAIAIGD